MKARFGPYEFDSERRLLSRRGDEVHLTPKAFDLLTLLIAAAPRVVGKSDLHTTLWPGTFVSDATLLGLVKELRRALDDRHSRTPIIRTVHRIGYAFEATLDRSASARSSISCWVVAGARRIPLHAGETMIGRDPQSPIFLDVSGVSRRHARIVVSEREAWLEDMGSKNGTAVGDELIDGPRVLRDGDQLHIGPVVVIYRASARGVSTDTVDTPRRRARNAASIPDVES